jgi:hypothetical protein
VSVVVLFEAGILVAGVWLVTLPVWPLRVVGGLLVAVGLTALTFTDWW